MFPAAGMGQEAVLWVELREKCLIMWRPYSCIIELQTLSEHNTAEMIDSVWSACIRCFHMHTVCSHRTYLHLQYTSDSAFKLLPQDVSVCFSYDMFYKYVEIILKWISTLGKLEYYFCFFQLFDLWKWFSLLHFFYSFST